MYRFLLLFGLMLVFAGCNDTISENEPTFNFDEGEAVAFESLTSSFVTLDQSGSGNDNFEQRENRMFSDQQAFASFWNDLHSNQVPAPAVPTVDFDSEIVIAVILGLRNSGGYTVNIARIVQQGDMAGVEVKEESPDATCATASVLTSPYHIVKLERLSGDVRFIDQQEDVSC